MSRRVVEGIVEPIMSLTQLMDKCRYTKNSELKSTHCLHVEAEYKNRFFYDRRNLCYVNANVSVEVVINNCAAQERITTLL